MGDHKFWLLLLFFAFIIYGPWAWPAPSLPSPFRPTTECQLSDVCTDLLSLSHCACVCVCLSVSLPLRGCVCVCARFLLSFFLGLPIPFLWLSRMAPLSLRSSYAPYPSHRRATWTKNCSVSGAMFFHKKNKKKKKQQVTKTQLSINTFIIIFLPLFMPQPQGPSVSTMWTTMVT